jgi:protein-serine/threonine kinase
MLFNRVNTPGNKNIYALKVIDAEILRRMDKTHEVFVERNVLSSLKDPSIVKLYTTFKEKNKLYFLLDKMPNGTLHDLILRKFNLDTNLA